MARVRRGRAILLARLSVVSPQIRRCRRGGAAFAAARFGLDG